MSANDWVWLWIGAAVLFGFGEVVTPVLFFCLSFAAGAAVAAIAAAVGLGIGLQWLVFLVASAASLLMLVPIGRRLAHSGPIDEAAEGASRWVGRVAVVLEDIPPDPHATGRVQVERAEWRAETDSDATIPTGAHVEVLAVRGTRLVVAPLTPTQPN
jgi:membrane protein implicated in regulation of membrane protease activity